MDSAFSVLAEGLVFPESPRWHDGALWFSDMYGRRVLRLSPESRRLSLVAELDDRPSGIGWLPGGDMLVVSMERRCLLRLAAGKTTVHADIAPLVTGDANDMVVDASGRAYVGNFGKGYAEGGEVEPANLVIVESDGTSRRGPDDLLFPNGTVISPGGRTLIVAEGSRLTLTEFTIEPDGSLADRREFAALDDIPDGIALDAAGCVWVAFPLKQEFARVERGGNVTDHISVAPRGAFACCLGGARRQTLFMCATLGGPAQIQNKTSEGAILAAEVATPGAGFP